MWIPKSPTPCFYYDIYIILNCTYDNTHTHILCCIHHIFITDTENPVDLNPLLPLALSANDDNGSQVKGDMGDLAW